jgi:hypothetical protein
VSGAFAQQQEEAQKPPEKPEQQTAQASSPAKKPATPAKDEFAPSEEAFSAGLIYWFNIAHPIMRNGHGATVGANPADLDFPHVNQSVPGAIVSIPAGRGNALRVSYFRTDARKGDTTLDKSTQYFGTDFSPGDVLRVGYTMQNAKISWDYLSGPFPLEGTWRLKTLWEVQAVSFNTKIDAPQKPTTDSSGNTVATSAAGSNWMVLPTLGLGVEKFFSKKFRWEAKGSGFIIPHHGSIGDTETFVAYQRGQLEIDLGAKAFYFQTTPQKTEYLKAFLPGAYVGFRWYFQ